MKIRIESPLMDFHGCTVDFGLTVHYLLLVAIWVHSGLNIIEKALDGGRGRPPLFLALAIRGPGPRSVTTYRIRLAKGDWGGTSGASSLVAPAPSVRWMSWGGGMNSPTGHLQPPLVRPNKRKHRAPASL